jgi:hypothetical protein
VRTSFSQVQGIKRLQHPQKFRQYELERQRMATRDGTDVKAVKEQKLYHGTGEQPSSPFHNLNPCSAAERST